MYDAGFSNNAILSELNKLKYKTKLGNSFGKNSISEILRNEKYTEVYIFNRKIHKIKGKRNNRQSRSADQVTRIPNGMPRIIDQELWDRVQHRIESQHTKLGERAANKAISHYLLSGKLECGKCGCKMFGKNGGISNKKKRYDYYLCNKRDRTY